MKYFIRDGEFNLHKSSTSCNLDEIRGILFGGISSRFWMLRKHMNSYNVSEYNSDSIPFYAWQCVTLQLVHREVDLVIKNEKDMDDLLKVVVQAMDTVDGNKDSAKTIKKAILEAKIQQQFEKDTT